MELNGKIDVMCEAVLCGHSLERCGFSKSDIDLVLGDLVRHVVVDVDDEELFSVSDDDTLVLCTEDGKRVASKIEDMVEIMMDFGMNPKTARAVVVKWINLL